jgi:threonyl-tRNA synthetase
VPVAERHTAYATEVCDILTKAGIRCDVDDREESVGKKVREAGMDWVPYVAIVGDAEAESGKLTVTIRKESQPKIPHKEEMTPEALIEKISAVTAGMPTRKIYTPKNLSVKPRFI